MSISFISSPCAVATGYGGSQANIPDMSLTYDLRQGTQSFETPVSSHKLGAKCLPHKVVGVLNKSVLVSG